MFALPFFVEVVPSWACYLWLLYPLLWGAVLFGTLVLPLCFSLLVHGMPSGEGWVDLVQFVCGVCVGCSGGGVGVACVSRMKSSFVLACFLGVCLVCSICQGRCESLSCSPLWFSAPLWWRL